MKYMVYVMAVAAAIFQVSCKEDTLEVYHGDNYVHFTPDADGSIRTEYNFATSGTTAEMQTEIPVEISLWGYLPETDFKCMTAVSQDGTTAERDDFILPETTVFRKGHHVDTLWVTVARREELLATDYTLTVKLTGAEAHTVAPAEYTEAVITVRDRLSDTPPAWWNTTRALGDYSDMKFRVFNIYLGKYLTSLGGYTSITFEEEVAEFRQWWEDQWNEGNYRYYAEDGSTPLYETIPE